MFVPETKYAQCGRINLAYQLLGDGPEYLILIPGWVTNVEETWNIPQLSAWLRYLASISTLVIFDKRGTGLSDTVNENDLPDIEQRAYDLQIVMSTIGIQRANFIGLSEGGPLAIHLAAYHPEKVNKLILIGSFSKWTKSGDYLYGLSKELHDKIKHAIFRDWGGPVGLNLMAPSAKDDPIAQDQWSKFLRRSASPNTAKVFYEMNTKIDVRDCLDKIMAPTLIMHRKGDALIACSHSEYLHENIPHSQLLVHEGKDHFPWFSTKRKEIVAMHTFLNDGKAINNPKLDILNVEDIFALYAIRDYLQNNFQREISIKDISRNFGINDYKIKVGFKVLFNSPLIRYLTDVRLRNACRLLMDPKETISSISEQVGYKYSNNFSVAFKRKYKITPLQYRVNNS
ncbi:alpha/beta fold hydrolase [Spongiimicrobium sp. 2-473A-2-J]|uniref:alpha/beta fold hydrolase n=1 Tax=Eudoraea algarum TaxID=3417568 RepID=UPI003D36C8DB